MVDDLSPFPKKDEERNLHLPRLALHEWGGLALWAGAIAFCAQFALASAAELESQAAVLGWVLVAILFVGGIAVWTAYFHGRHHGES